MGHGEHEGLELAVRRFELGGAVAHLLIERVVELAQLGVRVAPRAVRPVERQRVRDDEDHEDHDIDHRGERGSRVDLE